MRNMRAAKEKIMEETERVKDELWELETDQHPGFYRNEAKGRKRTAYLLLKLNMLEEKINKSPVIKADMSQKDP